MSTKLKFEILISNAVSPCASLTPHRDTRLRCTSNTFKSSTPQTIFPGTLVIRRANIVSRVRAHSFPAPSIGIRHVCATIFISRGSVLSIVPTKHVSAKSQYTAKSAWRVVASDFARHRHSYDGSWVPCLPRLCRLYQAMQMWLKMRQQLPVGIGLV